MKGSTKVQARPQRRSDEGTTLVYGVRVLPRSRAWALLEQLAEAALPAAHRHALVLEFARSTGSLPRD